MTETFFFATCFALLALTGIEPRTTQPMKVCQTGLVAEMFGGCLHPVAR